MNAITLENVYFTYERVIDLFAVYLFHVLKVEYFILYILIHSTI